jgi:hypothetical protein
MYGYYSEWSALKRVSISSQQVDTRDCIFAWAEKNYPALFPQAAQSQSAPPYYYRFYSTTNTYLGVSSVDDHIYYLGANGLQDVGPRTQWAATAGCQ